MKKTILWIMPLLIIMMAGIGYAACSITNLNYLNAGDRIQVNETVLSYENTTYAKANISISGCGNLNILNGTGDNNTIGVFNFSLNTANIAALRDDTQCTLTAKVYNQSLGNYVLLSTCSAETLYIDHTNPVLTLVSPTDEGLDTDGIVTFEYTCANASSATLYIENNAYPMTESSDTCTYTNPPTSKFTNGLQSWHITASDGLNLTTSATTKVEIRKPGGLIDNGGENQATQTTIPPVTTKNNTMMYALIFLIIGGAAWFLWDK